MSHATTISHAHPPRDLTSEEQHLRGALRLVAVTEAALILLYLLPVLVGPQRANPFLLAFAPNAVAKPGALALVAFFAAGDVRKYRVLVSVILGAELLASLAIVAELLFGSAHGLLLSHPIAVPVRALLWLSLALDLGVFALVAVHRHAATRSRSRSEGLKYLSRVQFRAARSLAEALIHGKDERVPAQDCAKNIDTYLGRMQAKKKWVTKLALLGLEFYPLVWLRPPLSAMRPAERLHFLREHFYQDVALRRLPRLLRTLVQAMIRLGSQLSYAGYYSDARSHEQIKYVPLSRRAPKNSGLSDWQQHLADLREKGRRPLHTVTVERDTRSLSSEVVIIGSGAAASVLADQLTEQGCDVLLLEKGKHVDRSQFSEDELAMLSTLYGDGALQLSSDFRLQVIQGSCVGGSTVVNNGVCFPPPPEVLERWNDPHQFDARLDLAQLHTSVDKVKELIGATVQPSERENPGARFFKKGVHQLGLGAAPNEFNRVTANIDDRCIKCGYCNIGCQFGAKLSMVERVLPIAQARAEKTGKGRLRILPGCEVQKLSGHGKHVDRALCTLWDGRKIEIRGKVFVVSAGAIASSLLLMRSHLGGPRVGTGLGFNLGAYMVGVFDEEVNAYTGLQLSNYLHNVSDPQSSYYLETWWNPPVVQALAMPGWFDDHYKNMLRYSQMACLGTLVASDSRADVRPSRLLGSRIRYTPTARELTTLTAGMTQAGKILLKANASVVMPNTFTYHELKEGDLGQLEDILKDPTNLSLGTSHLQGGNAISGEKSKGVVNPEFQVWGHDNLFVCDASVFPGSMGVNPQLTVMAMAHYAAPFIERAARE